jgi:hypothetical protein
VVDALKVSNTLVEVAKSLWRRGGRISGGVPKFARSDLGMLTPVYEKLSQWIVNLEGGY